MIYIFIIAFIGALVYTFWKKMKTMSFMKRLAVKLVGVYIAGMLLLAMISMFFGVLYDVYYDGKEKNLKYRMQQIEEDLNTGRYSSAEAALSYLQCYEEEFDYAWERLIMYQLYNRYAVCQNALLSLEDEDSEHKQEVEAQMQEYRQLLLELLAKSTEQKNELYVDYYENLLYNQ